MRRGLRLVLYQLDVQLSLTVQPCNHVLQLVGMVIG